MPTLTITLVDAPREFAPYGGIRHLLQLKKGYLEPVGDTYSVSFELCGGVPKGEIVHYHGDKRRFIYIQWIGSGHAMFRRIKLYFDQFMTEEKEHYEVCIRGTMEKDGSPACSTARLL